MTDAVGAVEATELTGEGLFEAVQEARGAALVVLGPAGERDALDDVLQAAWESAWSGRHGFDVERGSLRTWVSVIVRRRAVDHLRRVQRAWEGQDVVEAAAMGREQSVASAVAWDHADQVLDALTARQELASVMCVLERVMDSPQVTARALAVTLVFDDDVAEAAAAMGVSADVLRQARRELVRCARVVRAAQEVARSGVEVTMRVLIGCLPADGDAGDWSRGVALACAQAGGRMEHVQVEHVMRATGHSHSTARQYLAEVRYLLRVAATVIQDERAAA
ncbi:sigma-70 family RNA polymerase sigma factor [Micrococcus sp. 2A]|uniref:RNA polymerase sigma factor n=1 Tax=Micrococcus sp. 2A TaxID=3142261 RepID=UPI0031B9BE12